MSAILALDIGNTSTKIAIFEKDKLLKVTRLETHPLKTKEHYIDTIQSFIAGHEIKGGILSSVVPSHTNVFASAIQDLTGSAPLVINYRSKTGITIAVDNPESLGSDRISNAVAAYEEAKGAAIVIDLGTTTTTTVVDDKGNLIGGTILPGIGMMMICLKEKTGRLPHVIPAKPLSPLGNNTKNSIISGVVYGTAGAIERLIEEMQRQRGGFRPILTGGYASLVKDFLRVEYSYDPHLTLRGLNLIYERNC